VEQLLRQDDDAAGLPGAALDGDVDADSLDRLERAVGDVERALQRLDDGSYGTCEACGAALPPDALAEDPAARFCRAHLPLGIA
jgi:RNA polymerase-binding transcription factor DksA